MSLSFSLTLSMQFFGLPLHADMASVHTQRILEPPSSWDQGVKGKLAMQSQYDWLKLGVSSECHRLWPKDVLSAHE